MTRRGDVRFQRVATASGQGFVVDECGRVFRKRGTNGRLACKWCGGDLSGRRTSYCSDECSHEYRLRNEPAYMRACVFERDRGVCAHCRRDTQALIPDRHTGSGSWRRVRPTPGMTALLLAMGFPRNAAAGEVSLWAADHIVPVVEGGGGCGLDNMRTLCLPCHNKVTAELAKRLGPKRREQNRQYREARERRIREAKARRSELVQAALPAVAL